MESDNRSLIEGTQHPHQFASIPLGKIHPISGRKKEGLIGQEVSDLMWFEVANLWLRSSRLRPANMPSKISTLENPEGELVGITASIHDIADTYRRIHSFNSEPVLVYYEKFQGDGLDMLSYEGRHRAVGAYLADRRYILGRQIGSEHSTILSQSSPDNKKYYRQPIFKMDVFGEMFRNNMDV